MSGTHSDCAKKSEVSVSVAVVDDDRRTAEIIGAHVRGTGAAVRVYTDPQVCVETLKTNPPDVMITDISMPEIDGLTLLRRVKEQCPETDVIIVTGTADKDVAIEALKLGAFDFFEKPVRKEELLATLARTIAYRKAVQERDRLAEQLSYVSEREAARWGIEAFVGKSKAIRKVLWDIRLLQRSVHTSVLVTGESGTGKELIARAIHFGSSRSSRPFVPVNCSAIPADLAESAFFGHTRGAFTGATSDRKGCFEVAHEGTVFLDEIGDMPPAIQIKLLRVLEDGLVMPVGGAKGLSVDVRIIAATNADLKAKIASGTFRSDLFYRLAGFALEVPPLRERREDIPLLAEHFARSLSSEMGFGNPDISAEAMMAMKEHSFPGNVRELRNLVERALIESCGGAILAEHLHFLSIHAAPMTPAPGPSESVHLTNLPFNLQEAQGLLVRRAMAEAQGNVSGAARLLGVSRTKMYRLLGASGE